MALTRRSWTLVVAGALVLVVGLALRGSDSGSDPSAGSAAGGAADAGPDASRPTSGADLSATFGVFRGGDHDPGAYEAYEEWLGTSVEVVLMSVPFKQGWPAWRDTIDAHLAAWIDEAPTIILNLPMNVERRLGAGDTRDVAAGAQGAYDEHWTWLGRRLLRHADLLRARDISLEDHVVLRPGWEHNGTWYRWSSSPETGAAPADFVAYWTRAHDLVMGPLAAAGYDVRWDWNVARTGTREDVEAAFPAGVSTVTGEPYVDVVTLDVYDANGPYGNFYPPPEEATWVATWDVIERGEIGLDWLEEFADAHTEGRLGIDEWGVSRQFRDGVSVGGDDNPSFVVNMHGWLTEQAEAGRLQWHLYFDQDADDGLHRLSDGAEFDFSESAAEFRRRFGSGSP